MNDPAITLVDARGHSTPVRNAAAKGVGFANSSPLRNFIAEVEPVAARQLTGADARRVRIQAESLGINVPEVFGAVNSVCQYLGPVTPDPATLDTGYNKDVRDFLKATYFDTPLFDAGECFTHDEFQHHLQFTHDLQGDALVVFTEDENGRPVNRLIPALGIDNPFIGSFRSPEWRDGVKVGRHHRPLAYHVLADEEALRQFSIGSRDGYLVEKANAFFFANRRGVGHVRGTTRFLASGNTVIDMRMMDQATHDLFNLASKIGLSFQKEAGSGAPAQAPMEGRFAPASVTSQALKPDGSPVEIPRVKEEFMGQGPAVFDLPPGQTVSLHNMDRDLPDIEKVRASDFHRLACAYGLSVQGLFGLFSGIYGMTGPGFRVAMVRDRIWRERQLARRAPFVLRAYQRHIAWGLRTKQISLPKKDFRPFQCELRWAKDYTIDEQRDVKSDETRLRMGVTSAQELAKEYGRDALDVANEQIAWMEMIHDRLKDKPAALQFYFPNWQPSADPTPADAEPAPAA